MNRPSSERTKKSLVLLLVLITFVSCNSVEGGAKSPNRPAPNPGGSGSVPVPEAGAKIEYRLPDSVEVPRWVENRKKGSADPLLGLKQACARTEGASFDGVTTSCICSKQGKQTRSFVPRSADQADLGGDCVFTPDLSLEHVSDWQYSAKENYLKLFPVTPWTNLTDEQAAISVFPWNPFFMPGYQELVGIVWGDERLVLDQKSALTLDQYSQLFNYAPPSTFNKDVNLSFYRILQRLVYSPSLAELAISLGSVRLGSDSIPEGDYEWTAIPPTLILGQSHRDEVDLARAAYKSYIDGVLSQTIGKESIENISDSGCLGFCIVKRDIPLPESYKGHRATEIKYISQGTLAHHLIEMEGPWNSLSPAEALLVLNRAGILSAAAFITSSEDSEGQKLQTRIFSRHWQELTPKTENSEEPSLVQTVSEKIELWKTKLRRDPSQLKLSGEERPVIVCESQFSPPVLETSGLLSKILVGDEPDTVYGWVPLRKSIDAVDAWVSSSVLGETSWNDYIRTAHSVAVVQALLETGPTSRVIPVSTGSCLGLNSGDFIKLKEKQARVISVSFIDSLDDSVCREKYGERLQSDSKTTHLWVLGAGNDGRNHDFSDRVWLCPQSYFSGKENAVVVAGMQGGQIWKDSNVGENFADIAADVSSKLRAGTSFAAPRVSGVAAEIFGRYPNFTPAQVRLALLLGADIPVEIKTGNTRILRTLPVRSGGSLNANKALIAAEKIAKAPELSQTFFVDLLSALHCGAVDSAGAGRSTPSPAECKKLGEKRFELLKRNGVL